MSLAGMVTMIIALLVTIFLSMCALGLYFMTRANSSERTRHANNYRNDRHYKARR